MSKQPLFEIKNLKRYFPAKGGKTVKAVDDVTFDIFPGETFSLVGESGCGKTTCGRTILGVYPKTSGSILYEGQETAEMSKAQLRQFRRRNQMIFQDPYSCLDPRMTIGTIIQEGMNVHFKRTPAERNEKVTELLFKVGLTADFASRFPHELSGGQRQRIGIARALAMEPDFIVCDEPIAALDVSIQAQVLNLFNRLQRQHNLTYIFISHDLGVIKHVSDRIAIMYLGRVVELCRAAQIYENPLHPYTKALLSAIPPESPFQKKERIVLKGEIPSPIGDQVGCPLAGRCPNCTERCTREIPTLQDIGDGHQVACFLYH